MSLLPMTDLKTFCLSVMLNANQLVELAAINFPEKRFNGNKKDLVLALCHAGITLEQIRHFCRKKKLWGDTNLIKTVLKSGKLKGHGWEKARPSNLHLSIQNLVRECFAGNLQIDDYLKKGDNIIKHEFFIAAIHDIIEQAVVTNFNDSIPSITSKSTIDFVFDGTPYDLKVTAPLKSWTYKNAKNNPEDFAKSLYEGQDSERIRESAKDVGEFNRLYFVYDKDDIWETPEKAIKLAVKAFSKAPEPFTLNIDGKEIKALVIFLK